MKKHHTPMKINTVFLLSNGIFLVLISIIVVALVNRTMKQDALNDARLKMETMANQYFAVHKYFTEQLKPAIFELTKPLLTKEYFEPTWMSSTYAVREMIKYISAQDREDYYIKDAAINARSPENEADSFERDFLEKISADPDLLSQSTIQYINGEPYFFLLRRGELMETTCLRCHSTPDKAPLNMVHQYGPERSFHREVGDWVQAISIRTPLKEAYKQANIFSIKLSGAFLSLLFLFFGLHLWLSRQLLFLPLQKIQEHSANISTNINRLGEQIPLPFGRELQDFSVFFNRMSLALRKSHENLETLVEKRTSELSQTNEALKKEIEERKRAEAEHRETRAILQAALDNSQAGIAIADAPEGKLRYVNDAGLGIRGKTKEEIVDDIGIDKYVASWRILHFDGTPYKDDEVPLARALIYGETGSKEFIVRRPNDEGRVVWANAAPIKNDKGEITAGIVVFLDITDRKLAEDQLKTSLKEKETLLREVHHRVKNNMQVIVSLLRLQSNSIEDPHYKEMFKESEHRIRSMVTVHEKLYLSKDFSKIDFGEYVADLISILPASCDVGASHIQIKTDIENVSLDLETAVPCGLLLNELIANSMKHAFPEGRSGEILIALHRVNGNKFKLTVNDNGIGLPEEIDFKEAKSMGLRLISLLAEGQLRGRVEVDRKNGTTYHIVFEKSILAL